MSQKTERPVLSGQRIKTRKRDEKEKYDPTGFRDAVIAGLEKTGGDLDAISKYLDSAGNKLDYRRYGEVLFDILIAGGLLVPGGSISQDGEKPSTDCCIFTASEDMEAMHSYEQVNFRFFVLFWKIVCTSLEPAEWITHLWSVSRLCQIKSCKPLLVRSMKKFPN